MNEFQSWNARTDRFRRVVNAKLYYGANIGIMEIRLQFSFSFPHVRFHGYFRAHSISENVFVDTEGWA